MKWILNIYTVGAINVLIILTMLFGGTFIETLGFSHFISFIFVFLSGILFYKSKHIGEPTFRLVFHSSIISLFFLSVIHLVEYALEIAFLQNIEETLLIVGYMIFFAITVLGFASVLNTMSNVPSTAIWKDKRNSIVVFSLAIISLAVFFFLKIQLGDEHPLIHLPLFTAIAVLFTFTMIASHTIAHSLPVLRSYVRKHQVGYIIIFLAGISPTLQATGLSAMTVEHISHFLFYVGISSIVLGMNTLTELTGVYKIPKK